MKILKISKALRLTEALLMTGFIIVGAVFALQKTADIDWAGLMWASAASYLLMLSVYSANSLLGWKDDKNNQRLEALHGFKKPFFTITSLLFYIVSFVICFLLNPESLFLHFTVFALWFLYALPGFGKHLPVVGSILHVLVAIAQFNFAYMFFQPLSAESLLLSVYFALLITGGHLHHEIIDYEVDKSNKIKTSTVKWGIANTKIFSFLIFASASIYVITLKLMGLFDTFQMLVFAFAFQIHLILYFFVGGNIETHSAKRLLYRLLYRIIYFVCGLIVSIDILFLN